MEKRIRKHFLYEGFGFPVHLINAPMMKARGIWVLDINFNQLMKAVLLALATKAFSLTGTEIRYIRKYFRMTLEVFGKEFGVSHAAVIDWEKEENNSVKMNPATEKCIRLFALDSLLLGDHAFRKSYHKIDIKHLAEQQKIKKRKSSIEPLTLDAQQDFQACG